MCSRFASETSHEPENHRQLSLRPFQKLFQALGEALVLHRDLLVLGALPLINRSFGHLSHALRFLPVKLNIVLVHDGKGSAAVDRRLFHLMVKFDVTPLPLRERAAP